MESIPVPPDASRRGQEQRNPLQQWLALSGLTAADLALAVMNEPCPDTDDCVDQRRSAIAWLHEHHPGPVPALARRVLLRTTLTRIQEAARTTADAVELHRYTVEVLLSPPAPHRPAGPALDLTSRERQILALLGAAMTNHQIAHTLGVTEKTVKNHLTSLYAKMGINSRAEAVLLSVPSPRTGYRYPPGP